ncbi:YHS domain-containing protein [Coraliomargarita sp. SDUM461004]|uniref:YHS domain-containing protein n=1 Tax=Thalassobacterium sedimentorum TaxID=3041258 RepID=A0ABU1AKA2_9BACT|nr:DUF2231 domain-containing protein [Coraliomargarita sp. SDUM461004]MDQ8195249.1 YHS domain-containing protein [Coraliomargarita sp. SDUM461004]
MIQRLTLLFLFFSSLGLSAAEPVNKMCPVTPEEPAESWYTTEYKGKTIGFCCKKCVRKFNADPEAYLANLDMQAASHGETAVMASDDTERDHGQNQAIEDASSHADQDAGGHDHATDHGSTDDTKSSHWLALLGNFHVLTVHLPIALLPIAGLLEAMSLFFKSEKWRFAARLNFIAGASMAILAAVLGWIAASQSSYSGELADILTWHRWLGVSVASIAAIGLLALLLANFKSPRALNVYRSLAFILIVLVPVAAHLGGTLIYGKNYPF